MEVLQGRRSYPQSSSGLEQFAGTAAVERVLAAPPPGDKASGAADPDSVLVNPGDHDEDTPCATPEIHPIDGEADLLSAGRVAAAEAARFGVDDFDKIYERFRGPIYGFIAKIISSPDGADDLTQDVFVKVYNSLLAGTEINAAAVSAWVYRIAVNTATDTLRRRRLIQWLPLSMFGSNENTEAGDLDRSGFIADATSEANFEQQIAEREQVLGALYGLPFKHAQVLVLYEVYGFECSEIADMLRTTVHAIKMRLVRARNAAAETIRTGGYSPESTARVPPSDLHEVLTPYLPALSAGGLGVLNEAYFARKARGVGRVKGTEQTLEP